MLGKPGGSDDLANKAVTRSCLSDSSGLGVDTDGSLLRRRRINAVYTGWRSTVEDNSGSV